MAAAEGGMRPYNFRGYADIRGRKRTHMSQGTVVCQDAMEVARIAIGSMRVIWDAPIEMDDGVVLRADVVLTESDGRHLVLITLGPYAKQLAFQEGSKNAGTA